ncbi:MAG: hypothetical protein NVS4B5_04230 [Vulcanimicrobiaceae bacterium]
MTRVTGSLAQGDLEGTLREIVVSAVPILFDSMSIEAHAGDGWPALVVASGMPAAHALTVPLETHEEIYGSVTATRRPERPFDDIDRDVVADLATRLAHRLRDAQNLAREHRVAQTLQRALLPQSLPQGRRIAASAAYLPGTREAIVGGDWYDVFDLPDGRTAFSIGDVAGHGLQAAVIMGEVRQAFRAAAVNPKSPSLVLERANTIVNMRGDTAIVTAIFGILDTLTSTVTYAVAGHPAPILATRNGSAQILPARGIPLGVAESVLTHDWTFTLPPGSLFALYTDGLIEHSRDVEAGEIELLNAVCAEIVSPASDPAKGIVGRIFADRKNADDVAALVLSVADDAPPNFHFDFSALPLAVPLLRRSFEHFLVQQGICEDERYAILLSVGEAAANAVEHAYLLEPGLVSVRAERVGATLTVDVNDGGRWKPVERRDERGRGIKIMRALMDRIEIRTMQAETNVRLTIDVDVDRSKTA